MKNIAVRALTIVMLLGAAGLFLSNARRPEPPLARTPLATFPMNIGDWNAVNAAPFDKDVLKVLGVDEYVTRVYYNPQRAAVGLYIGFYASQRQGDTIHSPMNCLPGAGWEPVSRGEVQIPNADGAGRNITINRYIVQKGLDRQLVLYWYQGRGRVVANEYMSRALLIRDAMFSNRTDGSLVRVIAPIRSGDDAEGSSADALAQTFVRSMFPMLGSYLP